MLLIPMYHRVINSRFNCDKKVFAEHIETIAKHFPVVVPGEALPKKQTAVCLTFDDAFFDFYHFVFPLLKKLNLKAVLAVPVKYILNETQADIETRLSRPKHSMEKGAYDVFGTYCTWPEIIEMAKSGHVVMASHSFHHLNIKRQAIDLECEVVQSKQILTQKIGKPVDTFVYPHGNMTKTFHHKVLQHYHYAMRIGSAVNLNWTPLLYRFDAEHFWPHSKLWRKLDYAKLWFKWMSNKLRGC